MADPPTYQREDFVPSDEAGRRFEFAANLVARGSLDALRDLLYREPGLALARSPRAHRCTLLHYLAGHGVEPRRERVTPVAPRIARCLLDKGSVVDATSELRFGGAASTPLMGVVSSEPARRSGLQARLVTVLLAGGAQPDGLDRDGAPLWAALRGGFRDAAQALVDGGARVEHPVQLAGLGLAEDLRACLDGALGGHRPPGSSSPPELAPGSLEPAASPWEIPQGGVQVVLDDAFWIACRHWRLRVADMLLDYGANLDAPGPCGSPPLHMAAQHGRLPVLSWLLARGANLEAGNEAGDTALNALCRSALHQPKERVDYRAAASLLLEAGADPHAVHPFPTGMAAIDRLLWQASA